MLRCEGCGVMHHPGCWVRNSGCATKNAHAARPAAQAYSSRDPSGEPAPHPGEGTRVAAPADAPGASGPVIGAAAAPTSREEWPVIGGNPVPPGAQREREPIVVKAPTPPRRYVPPEGDHAPKQLPKVYGRSPLLAYWYVPAAVAVAIVVALGVIWGVDRLFGGGSNGNQPAAFVATPTPASPTASTPSTTVTGTASPGTAAAGTASPTRGTGTSTRFRPGDVATVTGAGDCLNVRTAPGTTNDAIVCLKDGEEVTVTGGPEASGNYQWWKVMTKLGEGWAVEDYLVKK